MAESSLPLVSILIPAFNAQETIAWTLESALRQTWKNKEIIVVDDGSKDHTVDIVRKFASRGTKLIQRKNGGAAAARNTAYAHSQGDFIQWLDADDLLGSDKIEKQLKAIEQCPSDQILLSSAWAYFDYRPRLAKFEATPLWEDMKPLEWLLRKMGRNLYMQTATWLVSRELSEAAGKWNTKRLSDDDGEYFCRVLMASESIRFVPEAKVYYRRSGASCLSYIGPSDKKMEALLHSMRLHVDYLQSLEESERVRGACLKYLQNWLPSFYPERPDLISEAEAMAASLGGHLHEPKLSWKYSWIRRIFGWKPAKRAQILLPRIRATLERSWDKIMFYLEKQPMQLGL
jgi:glycosyltransferase involved in cell wall biosynthesis